MHRRVGGKSAGRETAEAVRKPRFRHNFIGGLTQAAGRFLSAHQGKSSAIAAAAEMTDVLPGV